MRIGIPKETKADEHRVAMTPAAARELIADGHEVLVETGAGTAAGFRDSDFATAGVHIAASADALFAAAELIVKVKEPQPAELRLLGPRHVLFGYLHLAAERALVDGLLSAGVTAIAYETVARGAGLPLLAPMSRIAGRLAVQAGAHHLQKTAGGLGVLLGGVPGVPPADVTVIGAGNAGTGAVEAAIGLGADVTVLDTDGQKLEHLAQRFGGAVRTEYSTRDALGRRVADAALLIGTVLIPGRSAPKLVTQAMIERMAPGSVAVDVAIDQGGCFATSRPTTHAAPVFETAGVLHYCVTNIPAAVPRTSTLALSHATLPYIRALAALGWRAALQRDAGLAEGLQVADGDVRSAALAAELAASAVHSPKDGSQSYG